MTLHEKITKALSAIRPNAAYVLNGDNYDGLEWLDKNQLKPTWSEIENEIANPTPIPEPTIEDKLASIGLNLNDLKTALGL